MAARRLLSMASKTRSEKTRLAMAGSLVAFSAGISVSAMLLMNSRTSEMSAEGNCSTELQQSKVPSKLLSVVQSWGIQSAQSNSMATLKALRTRHAEENIEEEEAPRAKKIELATAISKTLRNRFQVGDSYVWLYRDNHGNATSWEKYTITDIQESSSPQEIREFLVTIEMSTKFEEGETYQTHHRIRANLIDHFLESSISQNDWRIHFEYFLHDNSTWNSHGDGNNVEAFEEKFDIFSMISSDHFNTVMGGAGDDIKNSLGESLIPLTLTATTRCESSVSNLIARSKEGTEKCNIAQRIMTSKLTQTKRHAYTEAWYGPSDHDTLSGIALYKEFPNSHHSFALIERTTRRGNKSITDFIEVVV